MVMSDSEVKVNVLQAKNPRAQIKICAELNATTQENIKKILRKQGIDLRSFNGKLPKNRIPEKTRENVPETPIQAIRNRIDSLLRQRAGIDSELADLKAALVELTESISAGNGPEAG